MWFNTFTVSLWSLVMDKSFTVNWWGFFACFIPHVYLHWYVVFLLLSVFFFQELESVKHDIMESVLTQDWANKNVCVLIQTSHILTETFELDNIDHSIFYLLWVCVCVYSQVQSPSTLRWIPNVSFLPVGHWGTQSNTHREQGWSVRIRYSHALKETDPCGQKDSKQSVWVGKKVYLAENANVISI